MRGVTQHQSMEGWLKSRAPGSGGGGRMLSGWKDQKTGKGQVDTWMHTRLLPMTVWRHGVPLLIAIKDKKTGQEVFHVWSRGHTCHETDAVLEEMYYREEKGNPRSPRLKPPERCGLCKAAEYVWQACWRWLDTHRWVPEKDEAGKEKVSGKWVPNKEGKKLRDAGKEGIDHLGIDPCEVLFRFVSEADDKENTTVHAGGFCGLFGRDEVPEDLSKAMLSAKISQKEAWKESMMVKPKSVMVVADNDKPEKGVQISEETKELGEKVKEEITKLWEGSEINIQEKPVCIRWTYDRSRNMGKQYTATAIPKIKPDARILAAIRGEAPDLSHVTEPFNQQTLKALFERHCKVKELPWAELFPTREQEKKWAAEDEAAAKKAEPKKKARGEEEEPEEEEEGETETDEDDDAPDSEEEEDAEVDEDGDEVVQCDNPECRKPMKLSAPECPHCGRKYEVEDEPEPEKPKMRSRSDAKKAKTSAGGKAEKAAAKKKDPDPEPEDDNQDDEIPF